MQEHTLSDNGGERLNSGAVTSQTLVNLNLMQHEKENCLEDTKLPQLPKMPQGVRESIEHGANGVIWLHFAVRPQGNRRKINFL